MASSPHGFVFSFCLISSAHCQIFILICSLKLSFSNCVPHHFVCLRFQVCITSQRPLLWHPSQSEPSVFRELGPADLWVWKSAQQLLRLWTTATGRRWDYYCSCLFSFFFLFSPSSSNALLLTSTKLTVASSRISGSSGVGFLPTSA